MMREENRTRMTERIVLGGELQTKYGNGDGEGTRDRGESKGGKCTCIVKRRGSSETRRDCQTCQCCACAMPPTIFIYSTLRDAAPKRRLHPTYYPQTIEHGGC